MKIFLPLCFLLLGISNHAQWTKTNGPTGITIKALLRYNNILFAGTEAKGVFKSTDNGVSWSSSNTAPISNKYVLSLGSDNNYLYMGTLANGVYRSADNGISWEAANAGMQNMAVSCLYYTNGYLFAGTIMNGLYRSADHGVTWLDVNQNVLTGSHIHSMVCQNDRLMVEADNYIMFSYDYGMTWDVDQGITAFYSIDHFFHHGDTLLASSFNTLFRTTDGGVNWDGPFYMGQNMIGFDSLGTMIYCGNKYGVFKSTDWGQNWTTINSSGLRWGPRGDNAFLISQGKMFIGSDEIGIYSSTDNGSSWNQCDLFQFARGSTIDDALIHYNGTVYSGTHSNGVFSTNNQGATWTKIGTPNNQDTLSNCIVFSMLHPDANTILAGTCGNGLYRSADNGLTWTRIYAGLPIEPGTNFTCIKSLGKSGSNIIAATTKGVYYSSDMGLTWLPTNITGSWVLEAGGLAIRNNIVCVGVAGFPSINYTGIYRSTDYGVNWTRVNGTLDISFLGAGGNSTMYAGSLFSAYVSHDDGLSWYYIPGIDGVFSILAWDNYAVIGNTDGIVYSSNNGNTWVLKNEGMDPEPNHDVMGLTKDNLFVYAGTNRNAVWRRLIVDLISNGAPLPLRLVDFRVEYRSGSSYLDWKTFTETNSDHFEIERSGNGRDFNSIGSLAAYGNSTSIQIYNYRDLSPFRGMNYYRLKMMDKDDRFTYSNVLAINAGSSEGSVTVFPNPVPNKQFVLQLNNLPAGIYRLDVINTEGKLVYQQSIEHHGQSISTTIDLPPGVSKGNYFLKLRSGEFEFGEKLVVN